MKSEVCKPKRRWPLSASGAACKWPAGAAAQGSEVGSNLKRGCYRRWAVLPAFGVLSAAASGRTLMRKASLASGRVTLLVLAIRASSIDCSLLRNSEVCSHVECAGGGGAGGCCGSESEHPGPGGGAAAGRRSQAHRHPGHWCALAELLEGRSPFRRAHSR